MPTRKRAADRKAVIRDTFSMPEVDHILIEQLRSTAAREGHIHTKSEVVRAGLRALSAMRVKDVVEVLGQLERVKPGRKVS